jgi:hypothetical protein
MILHDIACFLQGRLCSKQQSCQVRTKSQYFKHLFTSWGSQGPTPTRSSACSGSAWQLQGAFWIFLHIPTVLKILNFDMFWLVLRHWSQYDHFDMILFAQVDICKDEVRLTDWQMLWTLWVGVFFFSGGSGPGEAALPRCFWTVSWTRAFTSRYDRSIIHDHATVLRRVAGHLQVVPACLIQLGIKNHTKARFISRCGVLSCAKTVLCITLHHSAICSPWFTSLYSASPEVEAWAGSEKLQHPAPLATKPITPNNINNSPHPGDTTTPKIIKRIVASSEANECGSTKCDVSLNKSASPAVGISLCHGLFLL